MAFVFENPDLSQKAMEFADQIAGLAEGFQRGQYSPVDQLNRAALSIAANMAGVIHGL